MAQLTVYLDDETLKKIGLAAKLEHFSISKWVKQKLTEVITNRWPKNYFDLFGSLDDQDLSRPKQIGFKHDHFREKL